MSFLKPLLLRSKLWILIFFELLWIKFWMLEDIQILAWSRLILLCFWVSRYIELMIRRSKFLHFYLKARLNLALRSSILLKLNSIRFAHEYTCTSLTLQNFINGLFDSIISARTRNKKLSFLDAIEYVSFSFGSFKVWKLISFGWLVSRQVIFCRNYIFFLSRNKSIAIKNISSSSCWNRWWVEKLFNDFLAFRWSHFNCLFVPGWSNVIISWLRDLIFRLFCVKSCYFWLKLRWRINRLYNLAKSFLRDFLNLLLLVFYLFKANKRSVKPWT